MNHPHEQQSAAMDRTGELPDGEILRQCINSGQVSAAQAVAHADAGDIAYRPKKSYGVIAKPLLFLRGSPERIALERLYAEEITVAKCIELILER